MNDKIIYIFNHPERSASLNQYQISIGWTGCFCRAPTGEPGKLNRASRPSPNASPRSKFAIGRYEKPQCAPSRGTFYRMLPPSPDDHLIETRRSL